jgi:predicted Zn-dependent peptidase
MKKDSSSISKVDYKFFQEIMDCISEQIYVIDRNGTVLMVNDAVTRMDYTRTQIEGRINNKGQYALHRCLEEMCAAEPFGVYVDGYLEDIAALNAEGLYARYVEILRTAPIEFFCLGDLEAERLTADISRLFLGDEPQYLRGCAGLRSPSAMPKAAILWRPKKTSTVTENTHSAQAKLCVGYRSNTRPTGKDFYALLLMNELLGGGPGSKLFARIRERESLCYYINSIIYRFKSIVVVQSGIAAANAARVMELIDEALADIRAKRITDTEWANAQSGIIKKFVSGQDFQSSTLDFNCVQYLLDDTDRIDDITRHIREVTPDQAAAVAEGIYKDTAFLLE